MNKRKINIIKCLICNNDFPSVGLDSHLKHTHKITSREYKLKYVKEDKSNYKYTCLICKDNFKTERLLSYHIRKEHLLTKDKYIQIYVFDNIVQLCKCGCNGEVNLINQFPYRRDYISGHNENGMLGKQHTDASKDIMRLKSFNKPNIISKSNTDIELKFKSILDDNKVRYIHQYKVDVIGLIDFYLLDYDIYIEIDGSYWHPDKVENLNFQQLSNVINDIKKNKYFINNNLKFIRIKDNEIDKIKDIEDILKFVNRSNNIDVKYYYKIVTKEYISNYINKKGIKQFNSLIYLFIKFLRNYIDHYPYPDYNDFNFDNMKGKINKNISLMYENTFSNNVSNVGVYELKSIFKNYWSSSYLNNKSPYNVFNSNEDLKKIIINRLVDNNNDFSLATINRGMNVLRYSISFFKPQLAANIYNQFINNNNKPIIIDPCAGFGGRLIGFTSMYPNGKYIGIEPNIETFKHLKYIKDNYLSNYDIELYNITQEQFIANNPHIKCDLTFTSIPYYNKELYYGSDRSDYIDIEDWKLKFITNIVKYPNLLLNIPINLSYLFDNYNYDTYYIESNSSNFNNKINKKKRELLIKLR